MIKRILLRLLFYLGIHDRWVRARLDGERNGRKVRTRYMFKGKGKPAPFKLEDE